jgi:hypothetical protein
MLYLEKGNILSFIIRIRNTHTHRFIINSFIQHMLCFVFMYSFVPPFCKANFCGVLSRVFDKLRCATGGKSMQNTDLEANLDTPQENPK